MSAPSTGVLKYQRVIDNLLTSTWYDVRKTLQKDIFQVTPLYDKLVQGGRIKERAPDGTHFEIPFAYAKTDQNIEWFGRGHKFGKEEKEYMTRMMYQTRNLGDNIVRYWDDERKNKGKARILNYVQETIDMHKMSFEDRLATSMWTSGGAIAIHTLPELISTTPTVGSIGGIVRAENPYMQNIAKAADTTYKFSDGSILQRMDEVYQDCGRWKSSQSGTKSPDIIITTQAIYNAYRDIAREMGTFEFNTNARSVNFGMGNAMFENAEMFWDYDCPSGNMYFLNTPSLEFDYDPDNWMEMTEWKSEADSLDRMAQIVSVGQFCCNNFRKNAVISSIDATA